MATQCCVCSFITTCAIAFWNALKDEKVALYSVHRLFKYTRATREGFSLFRKRSIKKLLLLELQTGGTRDAVVRNSNNKNSGARLPFSGLFVKRLVLN